MNGELLKKFGLGIYKMDYKVGPEKRDPNDRRTMVTSGRGGG